LIFCFNSIRQQIFYNLGGRWAKTHRNFGATIPWASLILYIIFKQIRETYVKMSIKKISNYILWFHRLPINIWKTLNFTSSRYEARVCDVYYKKINTKSKFPSFSWNKGLWLVDFLMFFALRVMWESVLRL